MSTQEIAFANQTICVKMYDDHRNETMQEFPGAIGVGTGLAYYLGRDGEYGLVHVQSCYAFTPLGTKTEEEAKVFLSKVVPIINWNCDLRTLKKRLSHSGWRSLVEEAYEASVVPQDSVFLYPVKADGDIIPETTDANDNPQDPNNLALVKQILAYYDDVTSVRLVRMDARTLDLTLIHTYVRTDCTLPVSA